MLGRKDFTPDEIFAAIDAVRTQLAAFRALPAAASGDLEATYFNGMTLALDRRFVHRLRAVAGKDGTPLNELEMIVESLTNNGGVLRPLSPIKYDAGTSVLGIGIGEPIALTAEQFEKLTTAVFDELSTKFA